MTDHAYILLTPTDLATFQGMPEDRRGRFLLGRAEIDASYARYDEAFGVLASPTAEELRARIPADATLVLFSERRTYEAGALRAPFPQALRFLAERAAKVGEPETDCLYTLGYEGACGLVAPQEGAATPEYALQWAVEILGFVLGIEEQQRLFSLGPAPQEPEPFVAPRAPSAPAGVPAAARRTENETLVVCPNPHLHEDAWKEVREPLPLLPSRLGPDLLRAVLELEFPWMADAVGRVVEDLRLGERLGCRWARFRPVLLVGPPSSGKTRFAQRLAELTGLGFAEAAGGGASDDSVLRGTPHRYNNRTPCLPVVAMLRSGCANPLVLVDELDKAGGTPQHGDMRATLLSMLERTTARRWPDDCLLAPCDISQTSWIFTANRVEPLRGPLLSRVRVVQVGAPGPEHLEAILHGVFRDVAADFGVEAAVLPELGEPVVERLRAALARGVTMRRLRSAVESAIVGSAPPEPGRAH